MPNPDNFQFLRPEVLTYMLIHYTGTDDDSRFMWRLMVDLAHAIPNNSAVYSAIRKGNLDAIEEIVDRYDMRLTIDHLITAINEDQQEIADYIYDRVNMIVTVEHLARLTSQGAMDIFVNEYWKPTDEEIQYLVDAYGDSMTYRHVVENSSMYSGTNS